MPTRLPRILLLNVCTSHRLTNDLGFFQHKTLKALELLKLLLMDLILVQFIQNEDPQDR
jgi:hypothetical protein